MKVTIRNKSEATVKRTNVIAVGIGHKMPEKVALVFPAETDGGKEWVEELLFTSITITRGTR